MPRAKSTKKLAISEHKVLFVDCQTTGASPGTGNLLEIAWSTGSANGQKAAPVTSYLCEQPDGEPIPPRIEALTGIADGDMEDAFSPSFIVKRLREAVRDLPEPRVCVIHYARFESPFLLDLFERFGRRKSLPFETICTFDIARRLYPNLPSRGIRALGGFLGLPVDDLKRATSHVATTVEIWSHLAEMLDKEGIKSLDELDDLLSRPASSKRKKLEYPLSREKRLGLPDEPGVYRMLNSKSRVLYVGKATSLRNRVNSHFRGRKRKTSRSFELLSQVVDIDFTLCRTPLEAALLENEEIKRLDPPYNSSLKQSNRQLFFYSDDLLSVSCRQDAEHQIGPIASASVMEGLVSLSRCIELRRLQIPLLEYEDVEPEVFAHGIQLFMDIHEIEPELNSSPRMLLLLGLLLYRWNRNLVRRTYQDDDRDGDAVEVDEGDDDFLDTALDEDENDDQLVSGWDGEEVLELTAEDVLARLEGILIVAARKFLLSRELTRLLNRQIAYEFDSVTRAIVVEDGKVSPLEEIGEYRVNSSNQLPWSKLDVIDYDRIRILYTELSALIASDSYLAIKPEFPLLSRWR